MGIRVQQPEKELVIFDFEDGRGLQVKEGGSPLEAGKGKDWIMP